MLTETQCRNAKPRDKDGAALNLTEISNEQLAAALNALAIGAPVNKEPFQDDILATDASDLV